VLYHHVLKEGEKKTKGKGERREKKGKGGKRIGGKEVWDG